MRRHDVRDFQEILRSLWHSQGGRLTGTFGGTLEAGQIDASNGELISDITGEIELDGES